MGRSVFHWVCVCALGVVPLVGCGETAGTGGSGGSAGAGGSGGSVGAEADPDELLKPGPFEVGYREFPITYSAVVSGDERELLLHVWYPAKGDSGAGLAQYVLGGIALPAGIALDAPPVIEESELPFVVYSHGSGSSALLSTPYGELMASHGWVFAAPRHTGNAAFGNADLTMQNRLDRPNDITAIIDEFESGLSGDELASKADTSRVLVVGHSVGGYTSFASGGADVDFDAASAGCEDSTTPNCELLADPDVEAAYRGGFGDPRVVAIVPQAAYIFGHRFNRIILDEELAGLDIPTMLQSGRLDITSFHELHAEAAWRGLDHPEDLWVEMPKGAHMSFLTMCYAYDDPTTVWPNAFSDGCGPDFLDAKEALRVTGAYALAFGRLHVLGEVEWIPVLEGPPLGNEGDFVLMTH